MKLVILNSLLDHLNMTKRSSVFSRFMILFLFITCLIISCLNKKNSLIISELDPKVSVDKLNDKLTKDKYYLVQNFEFDNKQYLNELKAYAESHLDQDYFKYSSYSIIFYRESDKTNFNYKETPCDLILWHGNDIICTFEWRDGKYYYSFAYQDGKIISE